MMRWRVQSAIEYVARGDCALLRGPKRSKTRASLARTFAALVLTQLPSTLPKAFLKTDRVDYAYDGS